MKIKTLSRYNELKQELESIEEQLHPKKVYDSVQASSGAPAYSKITRKVEGYIHGKGTINLLMEQSAHIKQMHLIEEFIRDIGSSDIRKALELYVYDNLTWEEVANELNISGDIGRRVARYLKPIDFDEFVKSVQALK